MEHEICRVCGGPMRINAHGEPGDPVWICLTDDAAHRSAADAIRAERERLLASAEATRTAEPTAAQVEAILERMRPAKGDVK